MFLCAFHFFNKKNGTFEKMLSVLRCDRFSTCINFSRILMIEKVSGKPDPVLVVKSMRIDTSLFLLLLLLFVIACYCMPNIL